MAAGDHDAGAAPGEGVKSQGGGRDRVQVHWPHAGVEDRLHHGLADLAAAVFGCVEAGGTGSQVVGKKNLLPGPDAAFGNRQT